MRALALLLWLLHRLPRRALAAIGAATGRAAFRLVADRRDATRVNLAKCFPKRRADEREHLARAHFRAFACCLLDYGLMWWAPRSRILELVRLEGIEHLQALRGAPAILFVPHFVAMEIGAARLSCDLRMAAMYTLQKNAADTQWLLRGRTRFGEQLLVSRQEGVRPLLAALREGRILHYSPDQDYGRTGSLFVPFFGVAAATVPALGRIARLAGAKVLPCVTRMLPRGAGYVVTIEPPWDGFPGADPFADARRMNEYLERKILEMPEQYLWMHKRFKTRPAGEARFYNDLPAA